MYSWVTNFGDICKNQIMNIFHATDSRNINMMNATTGVI